MIPDEEVQEELQRQVEVECEGAVIVIMPPTIPGLDGTVLRWDALLNLQVEVEVEVEVEVWMCRCDLPRSAAW